MTYKENKAQISPQDALQEWLSNDMLDGPLSFNLIPQAAPNRHVNAYRVETGGGVFFVKVYLDTPDVAEREISNFQYFRTLPFVPTLKHHIFPVNSQRRLIAYDFIEGGDLHKQFTSARQNNRYLDTSVIVGSILQISQMREIIEPHRSLLSAKIPWALKSPIRRNFIPRNIEELFLTDYRLVLAKNAETIQIFPGYYFDRNPRNIMYDSMGIHQVDFGVIEYSSPLFDLVKLLRNGTDILLDEEVDLNTLDPALPLIERISTYPLSKEQSFLQLAYEDYIGKNQENDSGPYEAFLLGYKYAAIHSHFFYMTKYLKMLKEDTGDKKKLASRYIYHIGLAKKTLDDLINLGEPIGQLTRWIDYFSLNHRNSETG